MTFFRNSEKVEKKKDIRLFSSLGDEAEGEGGIEEGDEGEKVVGDEGAGEDEGVGEEYGSKTAVNVDHRDS